MKRLFDENDQYTAEAHEVSSFAMGQIRKIFDKFPDYSIRDISLITQCDVGMVECMRIMERRENEKKRDN